ncbi:MAG: flagellar basal body-associated FliL family protein [Actinomycetota bacterium]|nr:flagellar basal body-associated FliL family protein [Actinomycetota bacterium]
MDAMKSKVKLIVPLVLLAVLGGGAYKFVLAKPAKAEPKPKVAGEVYVLPKEFLVNLADGRFAKLGVGLVFDHGFHAAPEVGGHGAAPKPPEGFGLLPQEALVRDIVTDALTDAGSDELIGREGRQHLKEKIAKRIKRSTDVKVEEVLFTDVAVQ